MGRRAMAAIAGGHFFGLSLFTGFFRKCLRDVLDLRISFFGKIECQTTHADRLIGQAQVCAQLKMHKQRAPVGHPL
jgi:hypothetical protein